MEDYRGSGEGKGGWEGVVDVVVVIVVVVYGVVVVVYGVVVVFAVVSDCFSRLGGVCRRRKLC